jgi:hypothetical protein
MVRYEGRQTDPANLEDLVLHRLPVLSDDNRLWSGDRARLCAIVSKMAWPFSRRTPSRVPVPISAAWRSTSSCNDLAAFGSSPKASSCLIAPPWATLKMSRAVIEQASQTAEKLGAQHRRWPYRSQRRVNRFIVTTTAMDCRIRPYGQSDGGQPGDTLLMTKTGGLEGTAILAADQKARLSRVCPNPTWSQPEI